MKILISLAFLLITKWAKSQENYPTPPKNNEHLFYIQHSDNQNTFMYDAKLDGKNIYEKNPIEIYRILYEEGGKIKPLTALQNSMAYGVSVKKINENYFEFTLKANKTLKLYLGLNPNDKAAVFLTVNKKKMYLNKMFIQLKKSGVTPVADYIVLSGKDFFSGKPISEKLMMN